MRRTTISLPDDMAKALDREARRRGMSVSAIAREALADRLRLRAGETRELPFVGLGRSGSRDTARRAEEILAEEWDPDRRR
jgi:metal-responsive CopG/Arc/MetJ family transcriptional regulator